MATNQKQRQKKLERKKAKRRAKTKAIARRFQGGLAPQFARHAKAPILDCCVHQSLWDVGIGYVLLSRDLQNGQIAFANFLVDVWGLGVKDVHVDVMSSLRYRTELMSAIQQHAPMRDVSPSHVGKLVEGAVEFAHDFGVQPHEEYGIARELFGDIDPNECEETFEYGQNGKPVFISGPFDTPSRSEQIIQQITDSEQGDEFAERPGIH